MSAKHTKVDLMLTKSTNIKKKINKNFHSSGLICLW